MFKPTPSPVDRESSEVQGAGAAPYLDHIANDFGEQPTCWGRPLREVQAEATEAAAARAVRDWTFDKTSSCGKWATVGLCDEGHRASRTLLCGREWCDVCGLIDSDAHRRRFARWLPKLQQLSRVCQLVVTFPESVRDELRDPVRLTAIASALSGELKRLGVSRGVRRWHWFGDERPGEPMRWHPHLNFLLDSGYFGHLAEFKRFVAELVGVECVVHAEFATSPKQIVHMAKYITRATFRDVSWDPDMAVRLHGFRNVGQWGKWKDEPIWQLDAPAAEGETPMKPEAIAALERNQCPCCGKPIRWTKVVRRDELVDQVVESYGGGYARLGDVSPKDAEWQHLLTSLRQRRRPSGLSGGAGAGGREQGSASAGEHRKIGSEPEVTDRPQDVSGEAGGANP